jgi:uncharacterized protein (DUF58 family)
MFQSLFGRAPQPPDEAQVEKDIDRVLDDVGRATQCVRWDVLMSRRTGSRLYQKADLEGVEFFKLRPFQPGDPWRKINARQTMKTPDRKLIVRENRPERMNTDYVIVDLEPTHDFAGLRESKLWLGARLVATAILSSEKAHDMVHFLAYAGEHVIASIGPDTPENVLRLALEVCLSPPHVELGEENGLEAAVSLLPTGGNNVVWISDGLNITDKQEGVLADLAGRHRVVAGIPQDWREQYLPEPAWWWPFAYRLKVHDLKTHEKKKLNCDKDFRRQYTKQWQEHTKRLTDFCDRVGISARVLQTEHEVVLKRGSNEDVEKAIELQREEAIVSFLELLQEP